MVWPSVNQYSAKVLGKPQKQLSDVQIHLAQETYVPLRTHSQNNLTSLPSFWKTEKPKQNQQNETTWENLFQKRCLVMMWYLCFLALTWFPLSFSFLLFKVFGGFSLFLFCFCIFQGLCWKVRLSEWHSSCKTHNVKAISRNKKT